MLRNNIAIQATSFFDIRGFFIDKKDESPDSSETDSSFYHILPPTIHQIMLNIQITQIISVLLK